MNSDGLGRCLKALLLGASLHVTLGVPAVADPAVPDAVEGVVERDPYFPSKHPLQHEFGGPGPYMPQAAVMQRVNGLAVLECEVRAKAKLRKCVVVSESPSRRDFGLAALRMAETGWMTLDPTSSADLVGRRVRVPVAFNAPGGKAVP